MANHELRGRRWTIGDVAPVRFPAWRVWADSRVRMDDAILDSLAGIDLAFVALNMRSRDENELVPEIFSKAELPYGSGFSVSVGVARRRLREAEDQVVLNAFPAYVSEFDQLLGHVIRMTRDIGLDQSDADETDTGIGKKMSHLRKHANVRVLPNLEALWRLLVAVRNSVIHEGASPAPVADAWRRCGRARSDAVESAQDVWSRLAERPFPVSTAGNRLQLGDREVIGCQRALDSIAIDLASNLRRRIPPLGWAQLLILHEGERFKAILSDPSRNVRKLRAWCEQDWGVAIDDDTARAALGNRLR